jgi:membrane protein
VSGWLEKVRRSSPRLADEMRRVGCAIPETAGWTGILARAVRSAVREDFGIAASSIAFAAFLALLPLISLAASAYGILVPPEAVAQNLGTVTAILPANAQRLIVTGLKEGSVQLRGEGLAEALAGLAVTLFSARRAGRSLLHGINLAYRVRQERRGMRRQLVATALVLCCAGMVLSALISLSVLAFLQSYVPDGLPGAQLASTLVLFGSLTLGAGGALILIYRYAPAAGPVAWRRGLPGTIVGVVLWLGATLAFRFYVTHLARFNDSYGSLASVVVLMLWLMVSAWILLLGARVNADAMAARAEIGGEDNTL